MKKLFLILITLLLAVPTYTFAQGCMEADEDERLKMIGYIQPEYGYDFLGENLTGESLDQSSFYFRRARIGIMGNIPYDFSYYVMTEFSPKLGGPFILDAFLTYKRFAPYVKFSVGQFRQPFGLELGSTACHKLYTINRSEVVNNLAGPFRDFGFMVSGGTGDLSLFGSKTTNLFSYQLAILNGTGMNQYDDNGNFISDNNNKKDFLGRVILHPVSFLKLGASYRFGKHPPLESTLDDDQRKRLGFDAELKFGGLVLQGEYIKGEDIGSYTVGGGCGGDAETVVGSIDRDGFFAQAAYMTPWNIQPVIKYESYDPNMSEETEGLHDRQNIITYGVNYFFNEWTRVQINYLYKAEEDATVEIPNDQLLIQFQIEF